MNRVLMGMGLWVCFKRRKMPALPCLAGLEILLWPLVSHILGYDYADHYSYYNGGDVYKRQYCT